MLPHTRHKAWGKDQKRTPWKHLGPREKAILDAGWAHVQSVPYKASLRWLFYRLLQDGFYKGKKDYGQACSGLFSRARHTQQGHWRPDTLEDESREIIIRAGGCRDEDEAIQEMRSNVIGAAYVPRDHFYHQENYIELWFEANAMSSQFKYYTKDIDLVPMGGQPSIPHKWKVAKRLEGAARIYGKPIVILYFGDEDAHGHVIQKTIEMDVRRWAPEVSFDLIWCGLTMEQVERYAIPENPEKPGYQWEALSDKGAREIITAAIGKYIDEEVTEDVNAAAEEFQEAWQEKLAAVFDESDK